MCVAGIHDPANRGGDFQGSHEDGNRGLSQFEGCGHLISSISQVMVSGKHPLYSTRVVIIWYLLRTCKSLPSAVCLGYTFVILKCKAVEYSTSWSLTTMCFEQAVIKKKYGQDATNVGDEGGFAPNIQVFPSPIFTFLVFMLQGSPCPLTSLVNCWMITTWSGWDVWIIWGRMLSQVTFDLCWLVVWLVVWLRIHRRARRVWSYWSLPLKRQDTLARFRLSSLQHNNLNAKMYHWVWKWNFFWHPADWRHLLICACRWSLEWMLRHLSFTTTKRRPMIWTSKKMWECQLGAH